MTRPQRISRWVPLTDVPFVCRMPRRRHPRFATHATLVFVMVAVAVGADLPSAGSEVGVGWRPSEHRVGCEVFGLVFGSEILGHASAAMTIDTYADLFEDDLEAVSERQGSNESNCGGNVGESR